LGFLLVRGVRTAHGDGEIPGRWCHWPFVETWPFRLLSCHRNNSIGLTRL